MRPKRPYLEEVMTAGEEFLEESVIEEEEYLKEAMREARKAAKVPTYPVGAIIVGPGSYGKILGRGHNHVYDRGDYTSHAEIEAIRAASKAMMQERNFGFCRLYTTWEPCLMCCGAILLAGIKRVVWIKNDDTHGALRCLHEREQSVEDIYFKKSEVLEIAWTRNSDLVKQMDDLLMEWSNRKEQVLKQWRLGGCKNGAIGVYRNAMLCLQNRRKER